MNAARHRPVFAWLLGAVMAAAWLGGCSSIPQSDKIRSVRMEQAVAPMADTALQAGQLETARRLYARLLEIDPTSVTARMGLAEVAMALGQPAQAALWCKEAVDHATDPADRQAALLAQGRAALAAGDLKNARASFAALTEDPTPAFYAQAAWGFNGVGVIDLLEGNPHRALAAFERALRLAPNERRFHANQGRAEEIIASPTPAAPPAPTAPTAPRAPENAAAEAYALTSPPPTPTPAPIAAPETHSARTDQLPTTAVKQGEGQPSLFIATPNDLETTIPTDQDTLATATAGDQDAFATANLSDEAILDELEEKLATATTSDEPKADEVGEQLTAAPQINFDGGWLVRRGDGEHLQMGAYAALDRAEQVAIHLHGLTDLPVHIEAVAAAGGSLHRVRIGPISSRAALPALAHSLGVDADAIRLPWAPAGQGR